MVLKVLAVRKMLTFWIRVHLLRQAVVVYSGFKGFSSYEHGDILD